MGRQKIKGGNFRDAFALQSPTKRALVLRRAGQMFIAGFCTKHCRLSALTPGWSLERHTCEHSLGLAAARAKNFALARS